MILIDTSVWIDHFRHGNAGVRQLLEQGEVLTHPLIIGELACGSLRDRSEVIEMMQRLPMSPKTTDDEALHFIDGNRLWGRGIGYIDVQLLASTVLLENTRLWTVDARLASAAARLFVSFTPD